MRNCRRGDYFAARSIRDKALTTPEKVQPSQAEDALKALARAVQPDVPPGYDDTRKYESLFNVLGGSRYRPAYSDAGAGDPLMSRSLLETNIRTSLAPTITPPPPGAYIAIVETSPVVQTGVGPLTEEASFHVIRGRYEVTKK